MRSEVISQLAVKRGPLVLPLCAAAADDHPTSASPADSQVAPSDSTRSEDDVMSHDQLAESKEYGRRELLCTVLDMAIDLVYLGLVAFVAAVAIDRWLLDFPLFTNAWMRLAALFLIITLGHYAVSFPLSFYSGFLLEHKYHLSRQSFGRWLRRYLLQNALVTAFGLIMVLGLFAIIWWTGPWWWMVAALATFVVTVLLGQFVPVLILPLFYRIDPLDDAPLTNRLERLVQGTSLKLQGVFRMKMSSETTKANALLAGLGHTRRVILGDTLLDQFSPDEIEVVFAHEVGHHVYHHIAKMILLGILYSAASFYLCDRILVAWVQSPSDTFPYNQVPVAALPLLLFVVTSFSLVLSPARNALSRHFERMCDQYALQVTGRPEAYRSAFRKLAQLNKSDPDPHPLEVWLLHDHPPVAERLALADRLDGGTT